MEWGGGLCSPNPITGLHWGEQGLQLETNGMMFANMKNYCKLHVVCKNSIANLINDVSKKDCKLYCIMFNNYFKINDKLNDVCTTNYCKLHDVFCQLYVICTHNNDCKSYVYAPTKESI